MSSTDQAPFYLSVATPADLPAIAALQYDSFDGAVRRFVMGTFSVDDIPKYAAMWAERQRTETHSVWIKVVDTTTGQLVAASNWGVHVNGIPADGPALDRPVPWLKGEDRATAEKILGGFNRVKWRENTGCYIRELTQKFTRRPSDLPTIFDADALIDLHICMTDEKYRGRGAGSLMLQWGNAVADSLGLPCWVSTLR